jgi:Fur family transcriptional regulator, peroxide stress response regulator
MSGEAFRDLCAAHGIGVTHQRQVIWETLSTLEGHPSPEEVYDHVRKLVPSISLATIYKNVRTFIEHGLISEVSLHHGSARLETNMDPHHHMVCTRCRAIVDLDETDLEPIRLKNGAPEGFRIHRYSVEVHGLCSKCAR